MHALCSCSGDDVGIVLQGSCLVWGSIDIEESSFLGESLLRSDSTPTFSHTAPSTYTPSYDIPDTWDCITVVSDFPEVIPAHPLDNLPHVAPEPVTMRSLMRSCVTL